MYSQSTGEVNSNRVTSSLLRKRTRLPTHAHKVGALTFEVTDNFGSNVVLRCGAYGPRLLSICVGMNSSLWYDICLPVFPITLMILYASIFLSSGAHRWLLFQLLFPGNVCWTHRIFFIFKWNWVHVHISAAFSWIFSEFALQPGLKELCCVE